MSSISSYTNKNHIKMGKVGNFAGEEFLLIGGNLTWSDFDHSNRFQS